MLCRERIVHRIEYLHSKAFQKKLTKRLLIYNYSIAHLDKISTHKQKKRTIQVCINVGLILDLKLEKIYT